jgi:hypothetical protein
VHGDRRETWLIVALCVLAAARVFVFSAAFPFFNNVDEPSHVDLVLKYARGYWPSRPVEGFDPAAARLLYLYGTAEYLTAPERSPGGVGAPPARWQTPPPSEQLAAQVAVRWAQSLPNHEAHAPPVYYALAGAWYRLGGWLGLTDGARLYWIRFLNVPLFAALVWCAYVFCRDWLPGRPELRLGVPLLLAALPQDVFYSVNSDVLSPLLFLVSLMLVLTWSRRDEPGPALSALTGLLVALTFLVKYTNIALPVVFIAMIALETARRFRAGRPALGAAAIAALAAALPVAICFGRSYALLGDLTGTRGKVEILGWSRRPLGALLSHPIFTPAGFWTFWSGLMETFWRGEFVWHARPIASAAVDGFYALSSLAFLIAAAVAWRVARRGGADAGPTAVRATAWASVLLSIASLIGLSVWFEYGRSFYPSRASPYFTSGRLIAGALVPFLVLYVEGIAFVLRPLSRVAGSLVVVGVIAVVMTASEIILTRPIFANPYNGFHLP